MFYIYILYSESSDKYYVGHTDDPWRRIVEHNTSDHITYTAKHRPWVLMAVFQSTENRGEAVRIERYIKKQKSRVFIEGLIRGEGLRGTLAQLVRVPTRRD